MNKKEVIHMPKLYELYRKGYQPETIARVLHVSLDTVRTILGNMEGGQGPVSGPYGKYKKCA